MLTKARAKQYIYHDPSEISPGPNLTPTLLLPGGIPYCVWIGQISCIGEPATEVVVSASSGDVIHHKSPRCTSVITPRDSSERREGGREGGRGIVMSMRRIVEGVVGGHEGM